MPDINKELKHYSHHFKGKIVYCNCDDPFESNFFKYFAINFKQLGLRKLIATSFASSSVVGNQLPLLEVAGLKSNHKRTFRIEINSVKDINADGSFGLKDVELLLRQDANVCVALKGDGSFASAECIELLKQSDIVCTNPPFSKFRDYVSQLIEFEKKFLIIGNTKAIGYRDFFPFIKEGKIWVGKSSFNKGMYFEVPKDFKYADTYKFKREKNGKKVNRVATICWYTNLDFKKLHEKLILWKKYSPKEYPKYDNYDAIEVSKVAEIPMDYKGVMGVPITFMGKYNPDQFEIVGFRKGNDGKDLKIGKKYPYSRILIKHKHPES